MKPAEIAIVGVALVAMFVAFKGTKASKEQLFGWVIAPVVVGITLHVMNKHMDANENG